MAWTQQDAQQLKSLFQKAIKNGIEPVTALGGLPHEDDFELIGALTEGAMTDASKRHADHQYPVTAKANRKLPQSPTEPTGSKFEEGYMAPSMDVPYPSKVETIPAQSSLPPLPPGVISTAQWGKTKIGFGKFKGRDWSYQDLLSSPEEEARSYVKWPFRAVVLMPKVTLLEAEARYKAVAGAGLLVMRLEASDAGTDKVVKALSTSQGLLLVGAYEDAIYFVRGFRRVKAQLVNLLICEMAHAALADSKAAHRVVLEWEKAFRVDVLQSLYISSQSLEPNPVKGFEEATMQVPGVPSYEVVARRGGPGGPEVFSVDLEEAQRQGITVPLKLVVLPATGQGMIEGLAGLHHSLGIEIVEFLNEQVQSLTQGRCKAPAFAFSPSVAPAPAPAQVWSEEPIQQAVPDALLVTGSKLDPMFLLQAVERVAFKARGKTAGYIIILGGLGPAPTAAWRALSAPGRPVHQIPGLSEIQRMMGDSTLLVSSVRQDLPSVLQEAVVSTTSGEEKVSRSWLLKAVDDAIMKAADRWDLMYGHLLAYRESMEERIVQELIERVQADQSGFGWKLLCSAGLLHFQWLSTGRLGDQAAGAAPSTESAASWRRGRLSVERQYMLDAVGFPPVAHPDDRATREVTRLVEAVLRNGQLFPQKRRNHIFTVLLRKYHPDSMARMTKERAEEAAEVTQFLAGYRLGPEHRPVEKESTEGKGLECTGVTYAGSRSISPYWRVCLSMCFFNVRMCTCS
eukprot:g13095.t1